MSRFPGWLAVCCALVVAAASEAQKPLVVAGTVFLDSQALSLRRHFTPAPGVQLKIYRDGGDGEPTADDVLIGTTRSDAAGVYLFKVDRPAGYWVAVDSQSFGPAGTWAEQTFGPAGSLCAHPDGSTRRMGFESPCFAGRSAAFDDASALLTSEHLALVPVKESATGIDFAFSFDVVVSTKDGERMQGTLRQFLVNANTLPGPDRMRFVPVEKAPQQRDTNFGVPPRWWRIQLVSPLPPVEGDETVVDGRAYNFLSAASQQDFNEGRLGEWATIRPYERRIPRIEKPELELLLTGEEGFVCNAACGLESVALHGSPLAVALRANARFDHVLIGATPDGEPQPAGIVGIQIEKGTAVLHHVLVTAQTSVGILVSPEARFDGMALDVSRCGAPESGGGVVLLSKGSSIRTSNISANAGAGIILGSLDGAAPANGNAIDGSTISSNQAGIVLGPGSIRNAITRNEVIWNRFGGVTIAPFENRTPPRENRFSANRFDENGLRPIVLDLDVEDPNVLARGAARCERNQALANGGIPAPRLRDVRVIEEEGSARVILRGTACPGEIVELYQSFVTSAIRIGEERELPHVRKQDSDINETVSTGEREMMFPSIGEFNYLGATNTAADGTFEATFPLAVATPMNREVELNERDINIWALEVLPPADVSDRAFSAIAIDAAGNSSEMSVRHQAASESEENEPEKR